MEPTINQYETVIILNPMRFKDAVIFFKNQCQKYTGDKYMIDFEDLGKKSLAYPLKDGKFKTGHYIQIVWQGTPDDVAELERYLRINEQVLKFITVKMDPEIRGIKELKEIKSEQDINKTIDAYDVMLGLKNYV